MCIVQKQLLHKCCIVTRVLHFTHVVAVKSFGLNYAGDHTSPEEATRTAQWDDQDMKDAKIISSTWKEHTEQSQVLSSTVS